MEEKIMKQNSLQTLRLFSPLFPKVYGMDEYGDLENIPEDITAEEACDYEEEILVLIEREQLPNEGDRGLAVYLDDDVLKNKIYSIKPTVEEWNGRLWGVTEIKIHDDLTASEFDELTNWLTGQFSDGWGEGLEQRPINIPDGELYVSFWDSSNSFFIKMEEELKDSPSFGFGMSMN
jgi:hypothetical protein